MCRLPDVAGDALHYKGRSLNEPDVSREGAVGSPVWGEREMAAFDRAVIENSQNAVVACDEHENLVVFNPTAREWHGVDAKALPPEEWASYYGLFLEDGVTPFPAEDNPLARAFRGETIRAVPMVIRAEGQPPRYVSCGGSPFFDAAGRKIGAFIVMVDTTDVRLLTKELEHLASHDMLTGLPNRRTFEAEVERATQFAARGVVSSVLFADIDRFKACNDRFGHDFGDKVLRAIAQRMKSVLRDVDTVARIGGDEFGIVLWNQSGEAVDVVSQRLAEAVAAEGLRYELDIGLSIGAAIVTTESDVSSVLADADSQMYRMKASGGHGSFVEVERPKGPGSALH